MKTLRDAPQPEVPLVLLVDDNPDTLDMYAMGLAHEGFAVAQATDGVSVMKALEARRPDCIVADVRMPGISGPELRRILGQNAGNADIPVIALTGFCSPAQLDDAQGAGFESILLKPCLPEHLAREILRVLASGRDAAAPLRRASGPRP